jgi:hypothetical protein
MIIIIMSDAATAALFFVQNICFPQLSQKFFWERASV